MSRRDLSKSQPIDAGAVAQGTFAGEADGVGEETGNGAGGGGGTAAAGGEFFGFGVGGGVGVGRTRG